MEVKGSFDKFVQKVFGKQQSSPNLAAIRAKNTINIKVFHYTIHLSIIIINYNIIFITTIFMIGNYSINQIITIKRDLNIQQETFSSQSD